MSERYKRLAILQGNLVQAGSPVLLAAGALLGDTVTGRVLAQLKFQNIGTVAISAVKVVLTCQDAMGVPAKDSVAYQYADLAAEPSATFGERNAIPLPDANIRRAQVVVTDVLLANGEILHFEETDVPEALPENCSDLTPEQLRQLQRDGLSRAVTTPQRAGGFWQCACGTWNLGRIGRRSRGGGQKCCLCHVDAVQLFDMADPALLDEHIAAYKEERRLKAEREAAEQAERDRIREEQKRIAEEEARIEARKKRKQTIIIVVTVLLLIAAALVYVLVIKPNNDYTNAVQLMEEGKYQEASETFVALGNYKDAADRIGEPYYEQGRALIAAGDPAGAEQVYEEAVTAFTALGDAAADLVSEPYYVEAEAMMAAGYYARASEVFAKAGEYKDAASRVNEPFYEQGKALMAAGSYEEAIGAFTKADGYGDSADKIATCQGVLNDQAYSAAVELLSEGKYQEASNAFAALGNYSDAASRVNEPFYEQGKALMAAGSYEEAIAAFTKADGYGDSAEQISACQGTLNEQGYAAAETLLSEGKYQEASNAFAALGNYSDAAARVNEPFYEQGKALMAAGSYEEAIAAFTKADGYSDSATQITACQEAIKEREYNKAKALMDAGAYEEAITAFEALNGYSDSATQIQEAKYQQAASLTAEGKYTEAYAVYATISGYKDVDNLVKQDENLSAEAAAATREPFTKVGNIVTYGHYEQDNNTGNGKEAIEWIVLEYDSATGQALLLSRYGLDAHRFDASAYQGWDKSEIREWLNSTFLNTAFTEKEQEGIVTTTVKTGNNADWVTFAKKKNSFYDSVDGGSDTQDKIFLLYDSVDGGSDTQDKIFLLSLEEAMEYGGYSTLEDFYNKGTEKLQAVPTAYAVAQGAWQYSGSDSSCMLGGTGCCWWWLRSPGSYSLGASLVRGDGGLGYGYVLSVDGSVRPAFWLNLEALHTEE